MWPLHHVQLHTTSLFGWGWWQMVTHWYSGVFRFKYTFYQWMRQIIHNILIVVDQYLLLMGDKMIPDSAEPHLESFYPPFIADIHLPHQGVVDSVNTLATDDLMKQGTRASVAKVLTWFSSNILISALQWLMSCQDLSWWSETNSIPNKQKSAHHHKTNIYFVTLFWWSLCRLIMLLIPSCYFT